MQKLLGLIALIILLSCNEKTPTPKEGIWRATLKIQDSKEIPFLFEYRSDNTLVIYNADEKIIVANVVIEGDSIIIQTPVFEGVLKGRIISEKLIRGDFIKPSLDRVVPFVMEHGKADRFIFSNDPLVNISGNWETVFSPNSKEERYIAKGIFNQIDNRVFGTFRTTTGDYRYLEGVVDGDSLKISTFDGAHAFLFEAKVSDSTMTGVFYSGNHWQEPFFARRNQNYELPEADSLTYLKEGFDGFEFSFPNIEGEIISLHDEYYKNKVVIVQIMGTWCPNCLDETKYYTQYYNNHKSKDLEFVALAFEYAPTKEKAIAGINRLKNVVGVPYPILLAQFGTSNKKKANEKLPMLNHVLSYPTTIFIDKKGKVRKIHTGFNGPATGEKYVEFKKDFEGFVGELIKE